MPRMAKLCHYRPALIARQLARWPMFKKTETRKVPDDAPRRTTKGIQQAKLRVDGSDVWVDLNAKGRAVIVRPDWYAQLRMADGTTKTIKLCRDKQSAEGILAEKRTQQERIRAGLEFKLEETGEDFPALLERFHSVKSRRGCTGVYIAEAKALLRRSLDELGVDSMKGMLAMTSKRIEAWIDSLTLSNGSKNQRLIQLKALCRWLHREKLIPALPDFPTVSTQAKEQRRALTRKEVDALEKAAPWPRGLFYALAFATIARRGALLALTANDLNLADPKAPWMMLRAQHSKTKTDQQIPIPSRLAPGLKKLIKNCPLGAPLFHKLLTLNLSTRFWADLKKAKIPRKNHEGVAVIHSLRHGGTTELLSKGVSILLVQRMGGWASLRVLSKHYAHLSPVKSRKEIDSVFQ